MADDGRSFLSDKLGLNSLVSHIGQGLQEGVDDDLAGRRRHGHAGLAPHALDVANKAEIVGKPCRRASLRLVSGLFSAQ